MLFIHPTDEDVHKFRIDDIYVYINYSGQCWSCNPDDTLGNWLGHHYLMTTNGFISKNPFNRKIDTRFPEPPYEDNYPSHIYKKKLRQYKKTLYNIYKQIADEQTTQQQVHS